MDCSSTVLTPPPVTSLNEFEAESDEKKDESGDVRDSISVEDDEDEEVTSSPPGAAL